MLQICCGQPSLTPNWPQFYKHQHFNTKKLQYIFYVFTGIVSIFYCADFWQIASKKFDPVFEHIVSSLCVKFIHNA